MTYDYGDMSGGCDGFWDAAIPVFAIVESGFAGWQTGSATVFTVSIGWWLMLYLAVMTREIRKKGREP